MRVRVILVFLHGVDRQTVRCALRVLMPSTRALMAGRVVQRMCIITPGTSRAYAVLFGHSALLSFVAAMVVLGGE